MDARSKSQLPTWASFVLGLSSDLLEKAALLHEAPLFNCRSEVGLDVNMSAAPVKPKMRIYNFWFWFKLIQAGNNDGGLGLQPSSADVRRSKT